MRDTGQAETIPSIVVLASGPAPTRNWWFIGCGIIGLLLNAAYSELREESRA